MHRILKSSLTWEVIAIVALLAAASAWRWRMVETGRLGFDADEAEAALMAKDIRLGRDFPIFYSGQAYGGSLESYVTALIFAARGKDDVVGMRLTGLLFTSANLLLFYLFTRWAAGRGPALAALVMLAFAPAFFVEWSMKHRGGYLTLPLTATGVLWPALVLDERARSRAGKGAWPAAALGFAAGLGWWNHRAIGFAIGAVALLFVARALAMPREGKTGPKIARLAVLAVGVASFWLAIDHPVPVPIRLGGTRLAVLIRLCGGVVAGVALMLAGDGWARAHSRNEAGGRGRGAPWTGGVLGFVAGYAPVLVFMARGGVPQSQFTLAPLAQIALNASTVFAVMIPWIAGFRAAWQDGAIQRIVLAGLAGFALAGGVASAALHARRLNGARTSVFVWIMLAVCAVSATLMSISGYTATLEGHPRHLLPCVYCVAALAAVGWTGAKRRGRLLALAAAGLVAIHGLTGAIAMPSEDLNGAYMPAREEGLIQFLRAQRVHGAYVMDAQPARGHFDAPRWTFFTDEQIVFVPPEVSNRRPRDAAFVRREQRPAVWITRFPAEFVSANYGRLFARPLRIVDVGAFRVIFSDETERMYDVAYRLIQEPWYHPPGESVSETGLLD